MKKVEDFITQVSEGEDIEFLRRPGFDVNMRLFKSSPNYRMIIRDICGYIKMLALTKLEGYTLPYGMSGANVGIPFNIIAYVTARDTHMAYANIMINPHFLAGVGQQLTYSNCGSIRLTEPIYIWRYKSVQIRYYDEDGVVFERWFNKDMGGFTIQHEIDHNMGILITDKQVKEENLPAPDSKLELETQI